MQDIKFEIGNIAYQVTEIREIGEDIALFRKELIDNDKEPRIYMAGKILKNGKVSEKQGGMFYRFNSGRMLKVM